MRATIIGGGIGGLVAARRLLDIRPDCIITIVERSASLGGLLSGGKYGSAPTYFDTGTHIFQETGIVELDQFIQSSIPAEDLMIFDAPRGDIAGGVFSERFQENSHFPDLRRHAHLESISKSVRRHLQRGGELCPLSRTNFLADQVRARFGSDYADDVLLPRLAKMFDVAQDDLCGFALELPGVTRVIIDDYDEWERHAASDSIYRGVIGNPDQLQLPREFWHGRRSYYSRNGGSSAFMHGAAERLRRDGVTIHLSARVEKVVLEDNYVEISCADRRLTLHHDVLIFAAGLMPSAAMLGYDLSGFAFDQPLKNQILHMMLPEAPAAGCYYGCNLDNSDWYRFTNYAAFSGNPKDCRLTVEVLGERTEEPSLLADRIRADLHRMGILASATGEMIGHVVLPNGFPRPTVKNFASLAAVRELVSDKLPRNVMIAGAATGDDVFFQNEVVVAVHNAIPDLLGRNS